jgi:hypothetical protein
LLASQERAWRVMLGSLCCDVPMVLLSFGLIATGILLVLTGIIGIAFQRNALHSMEQP